jgi:hypothetical protein
MAESSVHPEPQTREQRGLALFRERGAEIVAYIDGTYGVPSRTQDGVIYRVDLDRQSCECPDRHSPCLHLIAATAKHARIQMDGARKMEEVRERARRRRAERTTFTPAQIETNLARMGG